MYSGILLERSNDWPKIVLDRTWRNTISKSFEYSCRSHIIDFREIKRVRSKFLIHRADTNSGLFIPSLPDIAPSPDVLLYDLLLHDLNMPSKPPKKQASWVWPAHGLNDQIDHPLLLIGLLFPRRKKKKSLPKSLLQRARRHQETHQGRKYSHFMTWRTASIILSFWNRVPKAKGKEKRPSTKTKEKSIRKVLLYAHFWSSEMRVDQCLQ